MSFMCANILFVTFYILHTYNLIYVYIYKYMYIYNMTKDKNPFNNKGFREIHLSKLYDHILNRKVKKYEKGNNMKKVNPTSLCCDRMTSEYL